MSKYTLPPLAFELCHPEMTRIILGIIRGIAVASAELSEAAKLGMSDEADRVASETLQILRKKLEKSRNSPIDLGCLIGLLAFHYSLKYVLFPPEISSENLLKIYTKTSFEKLTGRPTPQDLFAARLEMLFGAYIKSPNFIALGGRAPSILCLPSTSCLLVPAKLKNPTRNDLNPSAPKLSFIRGVGSIDEKCLYSDRKENQPSNLSPLKASRPIVLDSSSRQARRVQIGKTIENVFRTNNLASIGRSFSFQGIRARRSQRRMTVLQLGLLSSLPDPNIDAKLVEKVQEIEGLARRTREINSQLEKMKFVRRDLGVLDILSGKELSLAEIHAKAEELESISFEPPYHPSHSLLPGPPKQTAASNSTLRFRKKDIWQSSLDVIRHPPRPFR